MVAWWLVILGLIFLNVLVFGLGYRRIRLAEAQRDKAGMFLGALLCIVALVSAYGIGRSMGRLAYHQFFGDDDPPSVVVKVVPAEGVGR